MIYFDTSYLAKCYLNEPDAEKVRRLAGSVPGLASSEWARVEFASVLHRHVREGRLEARHARRILGFLGDDEKNGVVTFLPLTARIISAAAQSFGKLSKRVFLRSADAVHLTSASESGFAEIYSSDRHLLASARHFGLKGIDILS